MRKFLYICSAITVIYLSLGFSSTTFTNTEVLASQETPDSRNDPTLPSED